MKVHEVEMGSYKCKEVFIVKNPYKNTKNFIKACERTLKSVFGEDFNLDDLIVEYPLCVRSEHGWTCWDVPEEIKEEIRKRGKMSVKDILEKVSQIGFSSGDPETGWKEGFECKDDGIVSVIYAFYCEKNTNDEE